MIAPISVRLVVTTEERMASCLLRRLCVAAESDPPSVMSTRTMRPVVDKSTRHGESAISRLSKEVLAAPAFDPLVAMDARASVRSVRRGVP